MDNVMIFSIIGGVLLLACIGLAVFIRFKKNPKLADKDAAREFLNGLSDVFYQKITEIINTIDITMYDSLSDLEVSVLSDIYSACWYYTEEKLEDKKDDDILVAMLLRVIDRDFVGKFVDELLEMNNINLQIEEIWNKKFETVSEETVEEDNKLLEEFSNAEEYVENVEDVELAKAEEVVPTEEEMAALNPQVDIEEVEYNPEEDSSVEIVEDDIYIDANGRERSKSTGRFV